MVTEIGNNAILRSTGVSTAQTTSSSQEAKDFKVVVTIQDPPPNLLPGLSTTARITTAQRSNSLAIPIQALTIRQRGELAPEKKSRIAEVQAATLSKGNPKEELQGVFVLQQNKKEAVFVPVTTGISGTTDIEVTDGLKEGEEIVTGSYKVLRTLRNGASVKIDNSTGTKKEES
jgi:HlyD family secretion protein